MFGAALIVAFVVFMGIMIARGQNAWNDAAANPTEGNTASPLDVSDTPQSKFGVLGAWDFWISAWYDDDPADPEGAYAAVLLQEERSDWKLLATGKDHTEEALITMTADGVSEVVDATYSSQRVNIGGFSWPHDPSSVSEIMFVVKNSADDFCAGTDGSQNLAGGTGVYPGICIDRRCRGSSCVNTLLTRSNFPSALDDWIRIVINGQVGSGYGCRNPLELSNNIPRYGTTRSGVVCHYLKGSNWIGDLERLQVQEVDWSGSFGAWDWEIWYRNYVQTGAPPRPAPPPPPSPPSPEGGEAGYPREGGSPPRL